MCLINGHGGEVSSGLVNDKVSLVELACHIRMLFLKDHHVSQVNWNPSCKIDSVICEEIGDRLIECISAQFKVSFSERTDQSKYGQLTPYSRTGTADSPVFVEHTSLQGPVVGFLVRLCRSLGTPSSSNCVDCML